MAPRTSVHWSIGLLVVEKRLRKSSFCRCYRNGPLRALSCISFALPSGRRSLELDTNRNCDSPYSDTKSDHIDNPRHQVYPSAHNSYHCIFSRSTLDSSTTGYDYSDWKSGLCYPHGCHPYRVVRCVCVDLNTLHDLRFRKGTL